MHFKRTLASACAIGLLAIAPSSISLHASETAAEPSARRVDVSQIRIGNFGQVNTSYFRGEQPEGRDFADLAALGVKTIIDLRDDSDPARRRLTEAAGMKYVRIAMTTHTPPTPAQLAQFMEIVNDPAQQPVYVHCKGGRHRTGVMTAVYRMEQEGWTAAKAFSEMKQYRFGADFLHPEFKRFVYAYQPGRVLAAKNTPAPAAATTTTD